MNEGMHLEIFLKHHSTNQGSLCRVTRSLDQID